MYNLLSAVFIISRKLQDKSTQNGVILNYLITRNNFD